MTMENTHRDNFVQPEERSLEDCCDPLTELHCWAFVLL